MPTGNSSNLGKDSRYQSQWKTRSRLTERNSHSGLITVSIGNCGLTTRSIEFKYVFITKEPRIQQEGQEYQQRLLTAGKRHALERSNYAEPNETGLNHPQSSKYKMQVLGLSETRWIDSGERRFLMGNSLFCKTLSEHHSSGVGFSGKQGR